MWITQHNVELRIDNADALLFQPERPTTQWVKVFQWIYPRLTIFPPYAFTDFLLYTIPKSMV